MIENIWRGNGRCLKGAAQWQERIDMPPPGWTSLEAETDGDRARNEQRIWHVRVRRAVTQPRRKRTRFTVSSSRCHVLG
jgi:hypothetical protein